MEIYTFTTNIYMCIYVYVCQCISENTCVRLNENLKIWMNGPLLYNIKNWINHIKYFSVMWLFLLKSSRNAVPETSSLLK